MQAYEAERTALQVELDAALHQWRRAQQRLHDDPAARRAAAPRAADPFWRSALLAVALFLFLDQLLRWSGLR
jgi:hypothetical protein